MRASDVAVVLPAAGQGTRMGEAVPKQYLDLGGAPVLVQTLRALAAHPAIVQAVVVASPDAVADAHAVLRATPPMLEVKVVAGGATRRASVQNGLDALDESVRIVLVHDAVRPFVALQLLDDVIRAARTYGAAVPAVPVADTLRRADGETFGETVDRNGVYAVQTPQGFRRDLLERAFVEIADATTDDAALVAALGHPARLVRGDRRNLKLTTPDDLALARALWPAWTMEA
ncbi:MAG: 2-C-methyl-D-erythritol 4-phosphate cytidylyltransferase [Bacteroidetes bacterium]|nr:2-C-methyl-D-erythritol 4-phosphate cytidylyltransferase [Bacteroidota bacterium]